jgi:phosphohistidine phosphatase
MQIFVVRHGEAVAETENRERPLSADGVLQVQRIAELLKKQNARIECVYHSGKTRAAQTAQIIHDVVCPAAGITTRQDMSPNASTNTLFSDIAMWNTNALVVGHIPFLERLVSRLLTDDETKEIHGMPTASAAFLEKDKEGHWRMVSFLTPYSLD